MADRRRQSVDFLDDLDEDESPKHEAMKTVTVLSPFQVCHEEHKWLPGDIATVPESLADAWIRDMWVEESA